jgi:hypothetical protein
MPPTCPPRFNQRAQATATAQGSRYLLRESRCCDNTVSAWMNTRNEARCERTDNGARGKHGNDHFVRDVYRRAVAAEGPGQGAVLCPDKCQARMFEDRAYRETAERRTIGLLAAAGLHPVAVQVLVEFGHAKVRPASTAKRPPGSLSKLPRKTILLRLHCSSPEPSSRGAALWWSWSMTSPRPPG